MKARTLVDLVTLSSVLYTISKETHLMDKLSDLSEQGKEKLNAFMKEQQLDEEGKEMPFFDRLMNKAHEAKEELDQKMAEMMEGFYTKIKIAHTNQIEELTLEIEQLKKEMALAEARINHLENGH
jgi:polyhydroxyalkanoate synthesis regulator phasin